MGIWHKQRVRELLSLKVETGFSIDSGMEMVCGIVTGFVGAALVSNAGLFLCFLLARAVQSVLV